MCHIGLWVQCQIQGQKACLLMSWPDTNMSVLRLLVSAITTLIHRAIPHTSALNFMVAREATEKRRIQSDSELYVWNFEALIVRWRKLRTETEILVWTPEALNSFSQTSYSNLEMFLWSIGMPNHLKCVGGGGQWQCSIMAHMSPRLLLDVAIQS